MPIRPENKHLYPDNWLDIRAEILKRAEHECEFCGVRNYAIGYRVNGEWCGIDNDMQGETDALDHKCIKIVLTIAHLDHDPTNNTHENLAALCQRCHNLYDRDHRNKSRSANRYKDLEKEGQGKLL